MADFTGIAFRVTELVNLILKHSCNLGKELEALSTVLRDLTQLGHPVLDEKYPVLKLLVLCCEKACQEFQEEIVYFSLVSHDQSDDWVKQSHMCKDVDSFTRLLAGYNRTFDVALGNAHLRCSTPSTENVHAYQNLVSAAQADLENHLKRLNEKGQMILVERERDGTTDDSELEAVKEERLSTEKCLRLCAQLSSRVDKIQLHLQDETAANLNCLYHSPERTTCHGFKECKTSIFSGSPSTSLAPLRSKLELRPKRPVMSILRLISPPGSGSDTGLYQCYVEVENHPWEVLWRGSQQYPDFSEAPFHHLQLSEEASAVWSSSALLAYGSYAVVRAHGQGGQYPIAKIAHPNPTARRLLQHEYEAVQALAGLSGIAKVDSRPLIDEEGVFGFRMERLWKIDFDHLESARDEVQAGLRALHDFGYCHGDLSPSNVMRNELGQLVLIDLSFAGPIGQPLPAYIPGWAYNGQVFDKRVDDERLETYFSKNES